MDGIFENVFPIIFVGIFVFVMIGVVVYSVRKSRKGQSEQSAAPTEPRPTERSRYLDQLRDKQRQQKDKHAAHVADAAAHDHKGDEEHYQEIIGSLGDVNDEGCADLNGVRFIAHDLAYEISDSEQYDTAKVARAMVLGDVLNNPRFKHPYGRK